MWKVLIAETEYKELLEIKNKYNELLKKESSLSISQAPGPHSTEKQGFGFGITDEFYPLQYGSEDDLTERIVKRVIDQLKPSASSSTETLGSSIPDAGYDYEVPSRSNSSEKSILKSLHIRDRPKAHKFLKTLLTDTDFVVSNEGELTINNEYFPGSSIVKLLRYALGKSSGKYLEGKEAFDDFIRRKNILKPGKKDLKRVREVTEQQPKVQEDKQKETFESDKRIMISKDPLWYKLNV